MAKLLRCECGFVAQADSDEQMLSVRWEHISSDHPGVQQTIMQVPGRPVPGLTSDGICFLTDESTTLEEIEQEEKDCPRRGTRHIHGTLFYGAKASARVSVPQGPEHDEEVARSLGLTPAGLESSVGRVNSPQQPGSNSQDLWIKIF